MSTIKNQVRLLGNIGDEHKVGNLESGKRMARFSLATNENYKNAQGVKEKKTDWHTIVAWGKTAEIVEKYAGKGKQVASVGKLRTRSYTDPKEGDERFMTEVVAKEILVLGATSDK